jgi:hypothetical protein
MDALQVQHLSDLLGQGQGAAFLSQGRFASPQFLEQLSAREGALDRGAAFLRA